MAGLLTTLFSAKGRIRRTTWWLGSVCMSLGLFSFLWVFLTTLNAVYEATHFFGPAYVIIAAVGDIGSVIAVVWSLACLMIKRFHDRGKAGALALICLIPLIGPIWIMIECGLLDGMPGPNEYGPSPRENAT